MKQECVWAKINTALLRTVKKINEAICQVGSWATSTTWSSEDTEGLSGTPWVSIRGADILAAPAFTWSWTANRGVMGPGEGAGTRRCLRGNVWRSERKGRTDESGKRMGRTSKKGTTSWWEEWEIKDFIRKEGWVHRKGWKLERGGVVNLARWKRH